MPFMDHRSHAATLTLTDFLLARIAEDEAMSRRVLPYLEGPGTRIEVSLTRFENLPDGSRRSISERVTPYDPARVLAECEAKRRIVAMEEDARHDDAYVHAVRALAAVYADHPDYRDKWRP